MSGTQLQMVRWEVERSLQKLSDFFAPHCQLTFLMRNPKEQDGDLIVTTDSLEAVSEAVEKLKRREP